MDLESHKEKTMVLTDFAVYEYPPAENSRVFQRDKYWDDALEASMDETFLSKIYLPLIVSFQDEPSVDQGGPRADLIGLLLDFFANMIGPDHAIFSSQNLADNESQDDEALSKPEAEKRLFAYGLYSAIAIVQCGFCEPFILEWFDTFMLMHSTPEHPFIRGLKTQNVPWVRKTTLFNLTSSPFSVFMNFYFQLLETRPRVRLLFVPNKISLENFLALLENSSSSDTDRYAILAENATLIHFRKFLSDVDGKF